MSWFKVDDKFAFHPKAIAAGNAALGLWVRAGSWAMGNLTDGFMPKSMLGALGAQKRDALKLIESGLWITAKIVESPHTTHTRGTHGAHEFEVISGLEWGDCDGVFFKDWPDWNDTKAHVYAERKANRERVARHREKQGNGVTNALVTRSVRTPNPTHIEVSKDTSSAIEDLLASRPEIRKLLDLLDERVQANGFKPPTRNLKNTDAARFLLDRDGYTVEQVAWLINWATDNEFWRANIRSMSKLREKFEQLKAQATRDQPRREAKDAFDPDAILGRDLWQLPTPPEDLRDEDYLGWAQEQRAAHLAERESEARKRFGVAS
ncbi:hypothetical protein [Arthrobacter russicus]|uniref:Uncharacterized protein n=1 Tax=Arthrobacter russicus TaxID=172040 RepID=A0ABU1JDW7_9MICC|nr:hypothetical protein [Arthrobacter russicus]MDR6270639.1 hypothetical protein [Arthrobacter russicus]